MKLAKAQRAAIAILIPALVITFVYAGASRDYGLEYIISAMLWNHTFILPILIDVIAKIGFIAFLVLVLHPIVKMVIAWIKRG